MRISFILSGDKIGGHEFQAMELYSELSNYFTLDLHVLSDIQSNFIRDNYPQVSIASKIYNYKNGNILLQFLYAVLFRYFNKIRTLSDVCIISAGTIEASICISRALPKKTIKILYLPFFYDRRVCWPVFAALVYNYLLSRYLHIFSKIITINSYNANQICSISGFPVSAIYAIPNKIRNVAPSSSIRKGVLIFIGRLDDQKGLLELFDLLADCKTQFDEFWIVGDGSLKQRLLSKSKDLKFIKVKFWGWLNPKQQDSLISCNDVLILNSKIEGEPLVVMESLIRRIRIVSKDIPSIRHLIPSSYLFSSKNEFQSLINSLSPYKTYDSDGYFQPPSKKQRQSCIKAFVDTLRYAPGK